jgi:hypothetical protein
MEFFELDCNEYSTGRHFLEKLIYVSIKKIFIEEPNYSFEILPITVDKFISKIEKYENVFNTRGIYTEPGDEKNIEKIMKELKLFSCADISNCHIKTLSGCFLRYISQLMLITDDVYNLLS